MSNATTTYYDKNRNITAQYHHPVSPGISCSCSEKTRPLVVPPGSNQRPRQWVLIYTVFAGSSAPSMRGRETSRQYAYLKCRVCGSFWKTYSRKFINTLKSIDDLGINWPEQHIPFVPEIEDDDADTK